MLGESEGIADVCDVCTNNANSHATEKRVKGNAHMGDRLEKNCKFVGDGHERQWAELSREGDSICDICMISLGDASTL